jgi:formylglycine-generating enzyme required for sulfatase activity
VRLALFAEMVKGKAWTPATLKQVGGIAGLGVTFLEETLGARAANPEHQLHQRAAGAVLKALLPEQGTDIKGHTCSRQELLQASGYTRRPRDFQGLLRVLDTELRLITPTDPVESEERGARGAEGEAAAGDLPSALVAPRSSAAQYYQLTHDYLVPALRQWLTRKQRETRRGRMGLLLAERTALWSVKQESRQLPGWWEWSNILLFTRKKDWTALQRQMLRAATRKHFWQAVVLAVFLALIGWALFEWKRGPLEASTLVRELALAETKDVQQIVDKLSSCRSWAEPQLKARIERYNAASKQRLHFSLALLPWNPGSQKEYLFKRLLEADNPDEIRVICEALGDPVAKHYQEFVPQLWTLLEKDPNPDRRFRAAIALAYYDPGSERWEGRIQEVANRLVLLHPLLSSKLTTFITTIRGRLLLPLEGILRDPDRRESERSQAAELFLNATGAEIGWEYLRGLVLETEGGPYEVLLPWFLARPEEAAKQVKMELARPLPPDASENDKDVLAKRQAHAAVVLLQLDQRDEYILPLHQADVIWPMLRQGSDPRLRTYLIPRLGRVRVDPETFIRKYVAEDKDDAVRQALLLSLGQFDAVQLLASKRQALVPKLLEDYRSNADAGIHSAADWLLRHWREEKARQQIDEKLAGQPPDQRRWYVTRCQGHTMAIITNHAVEFPMGSPDHERDRLDNETLHQRHIPRPFALATKEVTVGQFREFLQANPDVASPLRGRVLGKDNQDLDVPITGVTWLEAVQYCRWLSEQEGVPEDQRCYPSVADIEKCKDGKTPLQLPANYLTRTGYRLPTEAEWEYACRVGVALSRHFGTDDAMLGPYAWYGQNSNGRVRPVGTKMPNDFGLFDMYGNAEEWCQDAFAPYPRAAGKMPVEDDEDKAPFDPSVRRVLRGGAFFSAAADLRSAYRFEFQPNLPLSFAGLRVAQTCR